MTPQATIDGIIQGIWNPPVLSPQTDISFIETGPGFNFTCILNNAKTETINFRLVIDTSRLSVPVDFKVRFYKIEDSGAYTFLGQVSIIDITTEFQKDLEIGSFLILFFSPVQTYSGTFLGIFSGFAPYIKLSPVFRDGGVLVPEFFEETSGGRCQYPIFFELVSGQLPPGITLSGSGLLEGILPDLDRLEEEDIFSGSQNWYYNHHASWNPWGRQWRFEVRAFIPEDFGFEDSEAYEHFCIEVFNNWDWDRDNFLKNHPYEQHVVTETDYHLVLSNPDEQTQPEIRPRTGTLPSPTLTQEEGNLIRFVRWYLAYGKNPDAVARANPDMLSYIENFKKSAVFQRLLRELSADQEALIVDSEVLEARALSKFIAQTEAKMIDGRKTEHLDHQMILDMATTNQKLPITPIAYVSVSGSVDLLIFPNPYNLIEYEKNPPLKVDLLARLPMTPDNKVLGTNVDLAGFEDRPY